MSNAFEVLCNKDLYLHIESFARGDEHYLRTFKAIYPRRYPIVRLMEDALAEQNWKVANKIYSNDNMGLVVCYLSKWKYPFVVYPHRAYSSKETCMWLHKTMGDKFKHWEAYMDAAASAGDLDLVKLLHELRHEGCTFNAMDYAAKNGHMDIVKFFHYNRNEGCSKHAMTFAAMNGHLDIVKFLHYNRDEGCTKYGMSMAAAKGRIEVVKFLHYNRTEGCTIYAMDEAIANGDLEMVKFLHYNRREGCHRRAFRLAEERGHVEVVKFLEETRFRGLRKRARKE